MNFKKQHSSNIPNEIQKLNAIASTSGKLRHWPFLLLVPLSIAIIFIINNILTINENNNHLSLLEIETESLANSLKKELRLLHNSSARVANQWTMKNGLSEDSWHALASTYLKDNNSASELERVSENTEYSWVESRSKLTTIAAKKNNNAKVRDYYYRSASVDKSYLSKTFMVNESNFYILSIHPLHSNKVFDGWLAAKIPTNRLMSNYIDDLSAKGYVLKLFDEKFKLLYSSAKFLKNSLVAERNIKIAGLQWHLQLGLSPSFYSLHNSSFRYAIIFLSICLLTILVWLLIFYIRLQRQKLLVSNLYMRQNSALEAMIDGLIVISANGIIEEVNSAVLRLFFYEKSELIGANIKILMPEPYAANHDSYIERYFKTGKEHILNTQQRLEAKRKDGTIFPMYLRVTKGERESGTFFTGVIQDITDAVAIEETLFEKETLLKSAVDNSSAGFAIVDLAEPPKYVSVNQSLATFLGYQVKDLIGMPYSMTLPDYSDYQNIVNGNKQKQQVYLRKDRTLAWGLLSVSTVKNTQGKISYTAHSIVDINAQKLLEMQLSYSEGFLKLVTDTNNDYICVKDQQLNIVFANATLLALFPKNNTKIISYDEIRNQFQKDEFDEFTASDQLAFEQGYVETMQNIQFPDGTKQMLFATKTRFIDSTKKPRILCIYRDVTVRENLIKQLRKSNLELEEFAYVASHDLKSPLKAVQKLVNWVEDDCQDLLPESTKRHFELIKSRTSRMESLLNDLLDYARINRFEFINEQFQLSDLSSFVIGLLDIPSNFKVEFAKCELNLPKVPLQIVLRNLISNAIKHHDKDMGLITINCIEEKQHYRLTISDDGPGIPTEYHEKVFQTFQTLKPRDEVEGSGMGLAIVKRTIEHYDGNIWISSDKTSGTTFNIIWPRKNT